jgi:2-polyprenyl-3-methyl-5-hydroxy-6-metoxy-1,4-benzoquinol methylase
MITINDHLGLFHDSRAIFLKIFKKLGLYRIPGEKMEHFTTFDEYPPCEMCGSEKNKDVLKAIDGCRIVECEQCGLWFTSPRINETKWVNWLKSPDTERNKILTENRIRYGVAMPKKVKLTRSGWFKRHIREYVEVLERLEKPAQAPLQDLRFHDVGCGVGYFLLACRREGIHNTSGNDLNEYAVQVMRERFNLDVHHGMLQEISLEPGSYDIVTLHAYIEHSYHPLADLRCAYDLLKKNGIIYASTFHTDSQAYEKFGGQWDMFAWNHVFHFSSRTLEEMIKKAGFRILENNMVFERPVADIIAIKD